MLIDSHTHLDMPSFAEDRADVLTRCREAGVERVVNIVSPFETEGLVELEEAAAAQEFPVTLSAGVHPHDASRYTPETERWLREFVAERAATWGEIGLDYHYLHSPREDQRRVFARQIRAARELGRPIVVHTREADEETLQILDEESAAEIGGVIHCFTGGEALAHGALELGFSISFSGIVTFKKADDLRAIAKQVPSDRILVETDSPYLAPVPHRGKRNESAWVRDVAERLAELRGVSLPDFAATTRENTIRIFGAPA